jgi:toxin FitB
LDATLILALPNNGHRMNFLVDTCLLSELYKPKPQRSVVDWVSEQKSNALWVSSITMGELERGIAKLDAGHAQQKLTLWLLQIHSQFENQALGFQLPEARIFGQISGRCERLGAKLAVADAMLAATALCHDMTLVTRNVRDFERTGVRLFNPWQD